jgi:hypothetical protein
MAQRHLAADARRNRIAWEAASEKHVREYQDLLEQARDGSGGSHCGATQSGGAGGALPLPGR